MSINIDTTSARYQSYLTGLTSLKEDMLPRFKAFSKLSREKQLWWLQRDPLMKRILKFSIVIGKWVNAQGFTGDVRND